MTNIKNLIEERKQAERIWQIDRTSCFWEEIYFNSDYDTFKTNFRMTKTSFRKLVKLLKNCEKQTTNYRETICLEKRVAVGLFVLGSSGEYRVTANLFGIGISTVHSIFTDFIKEVWRILAPKYMKNFPLRRKNVEEWVKDFENMGFPQCMGALDGCHIEVKPKKEDAIDYYNYKRWYSVVLLALVDAKYRFIYINVGSPGRCNDSSIFEDSPLKTELQQCKLLSDMAVELGSVRVPVVVLGDSAFRLSNYLMKPYPFSIDNSTEKKLFNYNLSKCRRVVENAFGHLKGRFRRIGKGIDNNITKVNAVVKTACALHNVLIDASNMSWQKHEFTKY